MLLQEHSTPEPPLCSLLQGYKANVKKDAFEFEFYK